METQFYAITLIGAYFLLLLDNLGVLGLILAYLFTAKNMTFPRNVIIDITFWLCLL
jgi:hypothetical protein